MHIKEQLVDKRVVQRALREGRLDAKAYRDMLDKLPDLRDKVQKPEPGEPEPAS